MTLSKMRPRSQASLAWLELLAVVMITAVAIFLRYYRIGEVPPGLNSDEAVGAVGALETLRQGPQLYYSGQGGGGSLGFYIAAIGFALFGPSVATLRGTAAFAGVVSVVATYFATREMFRGRPTTGLNRARLLALLATLGLAISLWHTRSSRVAFAAIGVPFLQVPGNYFLWRGLNTGRRVHFVVSGFFLASLMYIYLSGSFAPFVYLFFFLLQWLAVAVAGGHLARTPSPSPLLKQHFWNLVILAGVAFVLFLPMLYFYLTAPELATERAQQALFTNPLINRGDPWGTLWRSFWGNLAAFGLSTSWFSGGPPTNLILSVPLSLLFLIGFAVSLWRVRQPPDLFVLVYWAVMLVPSMLSPDAIPHTLRAVGAAPAVYTIIAVGVVGIMELGAKMAGWVARLVGRRLPGASGGGYAISYLVPGVILAGLGLVVSPPIFREFRYYMVEWPKTNDAQAAFHVYAVELAAEMSRETDPQAVFLLPRDTAAGDINPNYTVMFLYTGQADYAWVVDDEDTLEATLDTAVKGNIVVHVVRWKTSKHTGADPKEAIRYYLEKHGKFIETRSFEYYDIETFRLDQTGPDLKDPALAPADVEFGGQIRLTGYAFGDASGAGEVDTQGVPAGDLLWARLRFQLVSASDEDLKASVQVTDPAGHIVGQIDKLLLSNILHRGSREWEPGTEVDAYYLVPIAPASAPGDYRLGVTVYGADSLARLPAPIGDPAQVVSLGAVAVRPDLSPPSPDTLNLNLALNQPVTEELTLLGFSVAVGEVLRPGERASLALVWHADQSPADDYKVSLQAADGESVWPLTDSVSLAGVDYPTSRWAAGQVVRGWLDGRVPRDMGSGDYALTLRVVDSAAAVVAELSLGTLHVNGWTRRFDVPSMQVNVVANFGDQIELLGYDVPAFDQPRPFPSHGTLEGRDPGRAGSLGDEQDQEKGVLDLALYWRALSEMEVSYTTFVHLLDASGQVVGQLDHAPGDGAYPTTGWLAGEVVADEFKLPWPADHSPETVQLEVGIYDPATGERLPVLDEQGQVIADHIVLTTVRVVEPR